MSKGIHLQKMLAFILWMLTEQTPYLVTEQGQYPTFTKDQKRVFFQTGGTYFGQLTKELHSVDLNGVDEKTHITSKYANRLIPSPDNKWIAFSHLHKVYVLQFHIQGNLKP